MKKVNSIQCVIVIALLCVVVPSPALSESFSAEQIEDVFRQFRTYDYADDPALPHTVENIIRFIQDKPQLRIVTERQMIALLESDATVRAKQFVCHQLCPGPDPQESGISGNSMGLECYFRRTGVSAHAFCLPETGKNAGRKKQGDQFYCADSFCTDRLDIWQRPVRGSANSWRLSPLRHKGQS